MTDEELIAKTFEILLAWLKPTPSASSDETLLQIIELYESSGRPFIPHIHAEPSSVNDE
jgi:hypothetical protein